MKKSNFFFLKKGLAHQKLVEAFLHTGKHFHKLLWVLNNAMCCGWTFWFWFYQAFEFFFYSISFVQIFWFYPYICTVLYALPPPPISLCSNCLDFFLFIRFSRTLRQYCVWATSAHPSLSLYFWFKFIFTFLFWFYPYICTVLYAPPPPPYLFVQIVCVILSSWNLGGRC